MQTIGVRELKANLSRCLRRVQAGARLGLDTATPCPTLSWLGMTGHGLDSFVFEVAFAF